MVARKLQQFQYNLKKILFGAFGAWYFLCFLGQVTVPPPRGIGGAIIIQTATVLVFERICYGQGNSKGGGGDKRLLMSAYY